MLVLLLLGTAVFMLALDRPRTDALAILAMVTLPLTAAIDPSETLTGFGNPTVVLIAAMCVIGEGLTRTGVAQRLGDWLVRTGGGRA
jgi:di/tricarboxylate transporter